VSSVIVRNQNSLFSTGMLILESDCRKVCTLIVIVNVFLKYRILKNRHNFMYQIRRPYGLAFVIYFWWLGELLLLYI
jgi:hypothetical protein